MYDDIDPIGINCITQWLCPDTNELQAAILRILERYHEAIQINERLFIVSDNSYDDCADSVCSSQDMDAAIAQITALINVPIPLLRELLISYERDDS